MVRRQVPGGFDAQTQGSVAAFAFELQACVQMGVVTGMLAVAIIPAWRAAQRSAQARAEQLRWEDVHSAHSEQSSKDSNTPEHRGRGGDPLGECADGAGGSGEAEVEDPEAWMAFGRARYDAGDVDGACAAWTRARNVMEVRPSLACWVISAGHSCRSFARVPCTQLRERSAMGGSTMTLAVGVIEVTQLDT